MISSFKKNIARNLVNIPGFRTSRKIIVFESDDWGSIRMSNKEIYSQLQKSKFSNSLSLYDKIDCLENQDDFNNLLEIANEFKDSKGNSVIFTLNSVMQNPDFDRIRQSNYEQFYGVPFFQSYQQYYGQNLEPLWRKGIDENLIKPQFHAREHLNEYLWLKDLKLNNKDTHLGFDNQFFGVKTQTSSSARRHYLATYFSETEEEFQRVSAATKDGLDMFKNIFGYHSETFIASNYYWSADLELLLSSNGVKGIQAQIGNTDTNSKNGKISIKRFYTGQKNRFNQIYTVRNVLFEPYLSTKTDWVNSALGEIKNAFFWNKPAIICMHRINFVSGMNIENREDNSKLLRLLISEILRLYPEVEFMSSDQLINLIQDENK